MSRFAVAILRQMAAVQPVVERGIHEIYLMMFLTVTPVQTGSEKHCILRRLQKTAAKELVEKMVEHEICNYLKMFLIYSQSIGHSMMYDSQKGKSTIKNSHKICTKQTENYTNCLITKGQSDLSKAAPHTSEPHDRLTDLRTDRHRDHR